MTGLLDEVGAYLAAQGVGVVSTDIFLGALPSTPDKCIALIEAPGLPPIRTMGNAGQAFLDRPAFQVIARDAVDEYAAARVVAQTVWDELSALGDATLTTVHYLDITAQSSPFSLGADANERPQVVCTYEVVKES